MEQSMTSRDGIHTSLGSWDLASKPEPGNRDGGQGEEKGGKRLCWGRARRGTTRGTRGGVCGVIPPHLQTQVLLPPRTPEPGLPISRALPRRSAAAGGQVEGRAHLQQGLVSGLAPRCPGGTVQGGGGGLRRRHRGSGVTARRTSDGKSILPMDLASYKAWG